MRPPDALPDDPDQEMLPIATVEPQKLPSVPVDFEANKQSWAGDVRALDGDVVVHYKGYVLRADHVVYHQSTTELEAEGHLQVEGGPEDVRINADHGDMRLNMHIGRFFQVTGSEGVRSNGRSIVYSTANPFLFSGRVLIQTGEGKYRIVDGSMTNCRLPQAGLAISFEEHHAGGRRSFNAQLRI